MLKERHNNVRLKTHNNLISSVHTIIKTKIPNNLLPPVSNAFLSFLQTRGSQLFSLNRDYVLFKNIYILPLKNKQKHIFRLSHSFRVCINYDRVVRTFLRTMLNSIAVVLSPPLFIFFVTKPSTGLMSLSLCDRKKSKRTISQCVPAS